MNFDTLEKAVTSPITEAFGRDHDRLEALESLAFAARNRGDFTEASRSFAAFAEGLRRHIVFEEEDLFPVLEREMGFPPDAGPTAVMREEHAQIRALLEEIGAGIGDPAADVETRRQGLHAVLQEHNMKEEEVLYPAADQALGHGMAEELARRIR